MALSRVRLMSYRFAVFLLTLRLSLLFHLFCSMKGTLMSFISTEELMQEMRHLEDDWSGGVVSPKTKCPIPTDATSSEAMLKAQSHIIRDTFDMMCPLFEHLIKLPIHDTLVRDMSSYVALVSAFSELNTAGPIHQATRSPEGKDRRILPRSQDDMAMLKQSVRRFEKLGGSLDKDSDESDSGDEGWEELMDQCASLKRRRAPNVSYDMIEAPQQTAGISQPTVGASDPTDRASQDTARQARKSTDTAITAFRVRTSYETAFRVPISQETVRQAQPSEDKAQASEDTT